MKKITVFIGIVVLAVAIYYGSGFFTQFSSTPKYSPEQALELLQQGHERYLSNKNIHRDQYKEQREALTHKQEPFAAILGCSDSRVEPAIVFDQGLGDLFVVRVAGNVCDDLVLGSLEYAVQQLHVPLILVLGHDNCGAVAATVKALQHPRAKDAAPTHIDAVIEAISPAVNNILHAKDAEDILDRAVRENIKFAVIQLKETHPILQEAVTAKKLLILGACYDIKTGKVQILS